MTWEPAAIKQCCLCVCCFMKVDVTDVDNFTKMVELWFVFSMI